MRSIAGTRAASSARIRPLLVGAALLLSACGGGEAESREVEAEPVSIGKGSVTVVASEPIASGPILSGTLEAERAATVRAEAGGSVLGTSAEEGQRVGAGQLLARIEDAAARDALLSAQSGVRAAESAQRTAQREVERTEQLVQGGALAERDLEVARNNLSAAQAQLADARARLAAAQKQVESTQVRSPIAGVVSERAVNAGDVVSPGSPLFTVIDPASMQLAASVPAEQLAALRIGTPVEFEVRGYPGRAFRGEVKRVNPAVDPATGQVPILVSIPNAEGALLAGLFAEGQVQSESRRALVVPAEAVDETGAAPLVLKIEGGVVRSVPVRIGMRDRATERVEILSGVAAGDTLLLGAARSVTPGTRVRVGAVAPAAEQGG